MAQMDLLIEANVEEITPQQAALWLEVNLHNRPLQYQRAQALAGAIGRGEWALNGDAIRFATNGQLIDGQHRLQAIVIAGKTVRSLVVRGLAPDSFATIDTNRNVRNARDVMALAGITNYNVVAPMARLMFYYEQCGNPYDSTIEKNPSAEQLLKVAQRPRFNECANRVIAARWCRKFVGAGLTGFAMYVFGQHRQEHALDFFRKLETGIGLEEGSPLLLLRDRLTSAATSSHDRLRPIAKGAYLFKAWRLYLAGADVKQLKLVFAKHIPLKEHFVMDTRPAKSLILGSENDVDH